MKRKAPGQEDVRGILTQIQLNHRYPISFNHENTEQKTMIMQYNFKPANVDMNQTSTLSIDHNNEDGENDAILKTHTIDHKELEFKGISTPSTGHEYLLEYSVAEQAFVLRKVDMSVSNMRPQFASSNNSTVQHDPSTISAHDVLQRMIKNGKKKKAANTKTTTVSTASSTSTTTTTTTTTVTTNISSTVATPAAI
jgi:hypothetical protein